MGLFNKKNNDVSFNDAMEQRRTIYNLESTISIDDSELEELMQLNMYLQHSILNLLVSFYY